MGDRKWIKPIIVLFWHIYRVKFKSNVMTVGNLRPINSWPIKDWKKNLICILMVKTANKSSKRLKFENRNKNKKNEVKTNIIQLVKIKRVICDFKMYFEFKFIM